MTGVAGEHDFEQPGVAHVPLHQLVNVARAERPVRHAHRQTVDRYFGHEAVGNRLEYDGRPLEPEVARQILDPRHLFTPIVGHGAAPGATASAACASVVKKWRTAPAMSSGPLIVNRP